MKGAAADLLAGRATEDGERILIRIKASQSDQGQVAFEFHVSRTFN